jgi:hypothetical protein
MTTLTPGLLIDFWCHLEDGELLPLREQMLEWLSDPQLECRIEEADERLKNLRARLQQVRKMRSPYRGRQRRRPTFQARRKQILSQIECAIAAADLQLGAMTMVMFARARTSRKVG